MIPAVFLDRDNTIIHNDGDLGDPAQVRLIQGAASAIASLRGLGYRIVVVTNQGGVARGKYTEEDVDRVHARISELVKQMTGGMIDRYYFCPYHPKGTVEKYCREHPWRKPQPGMLLQAAEDLKLDLSQSWMIGDQMRDIQAGDAAGTRTILLQDDRRPPSQGMLQMPMPHFVTSSLIEAVRIIAQQRKPEAVDPRATGKPGRWNPVPLAAQRTGQVSSSATGSEPPSAATGDSSAVAAPTAQVGHAGAAGSDATREVQVTPSAASKPVSVAIKPAAAATPAPAAIDLASSTASQVTSSPMATPDGLSAPESAAITPRVEQAAPSVAAPATRSLPAAGSAPATAAVQSPDANADSPAIPAPAPRIATPPAPAANPGEQEHLLRQILQELRNQRAFAGEFSFLQVLAIVLQGGAVVCLLAGLLMGAHDASLYLRWVGVALVAQLATIAVLLFRR